MIDNHEDNSEPRKETLGSHFQRTRRGQHKTLEEVSDVIRINIGTLAALEADDYDKLRAEVFTRGFIKLYAKYLGLDQNETLKQYISQENADPEKPADRPYRRDILDGAPMAHPPSFFKGNRRSLTITLLLTVLVGFYILGTVFKSAEQPTGEDSPEQEIAQVLVDEQALPLSAIVSLEPEVGSLAVPSGNEPPTQEPQRLAQKKPEPTTALPPITPAGAGQLPQPKSVVPLVMPTPSTSPKMEPKPAPLAQPPTALTPPATPAGRVTTAPDHAPPEPPTVSPGSPATGQPTRSQSFRPVTVKIVNTAIDGVVGTAPETATPKPAAATYVLEARFRENSWVHIEVDDQPIREYNSQADVTRVWRATSRLVLQLDNAEAVDLTLNGARLPLAGEQGEVVTLRIP